jgi:hypothetical protein
MSGEVVYDLAYTAARDERMSLDREAQATVDLLRQHGVYGLSTYDGCRCAHFMVHGFHVDISCHKSSGGVKWHRWGVIRVYSNHLYVEPDDLRAVAKILNELLLEPGQEDYWVTRFCAWATDDKQKCSYCSKPRQDERGYLCDTCLNATDPIGNKVADLRDYRRITLD